MLLLNNFEFVEEELERVNARYEEVPARCPCFILFLDNYKLRSYLGIILFLRSA